MPPQHTNPGGGFTQNQLRNLVDRQAADGCIARIAAAARPDDWLSAVALSMFLE